MDKVEDCRLTESERKRKQKSTQFGYSDTVYCLSCHTPKGVAWGDVSCIVYICDECYFKFGGLNLPEIPEELLDAVR